MCSSMFIEYWRKKKDFKVSPFTAGQVQYNTAAAALLVDILQLMTPSFSTVDMISSPLVEFRRQSAVVISTTG